jgi:hypothetical protein
MEKTNNYHQSFYGLKKQDCYSVTKPGMKGYEWFKYFKEVIYPDYWGIGGTDTVYSRRTEEFENRDTDEGKKADNINMLKSFNTWFYAKSDTVLIPKEEDISNWIKENKKNNNLSTVKTNEKNIRYIPR